MKLVVSVLRDSWKWAIGTGLVGLMLANPVLAEERVLQALTVTGRGTESVTTTLTQVRLGVEAQGKTANEVQADVARRSTAVVNLLRSRQVDKLETTGISLSPTYRYDNGAQTLTGYSASNIVSFRTETPKAGTLLDEAVQAGATRIDGVSFIATDPAIAAARQTALRRATQDAQVQAATVLSSLNLSQKAIVGIQINNAIAPPVPNFSDRAALRSLAQAPTPVIGGEQQIEATVTLQISY